MVHINKGDMMSDAEYRFEQWLAETLISADKEGFIKVEEIVLESHTDYQRTFPGPCRDVVITFRRRKDVSVDN